LIVSHIATTGGDLGLNPDNVGVLHVLQRKRSVVQQLHAEPAVMELVAHQLAVGCEPWQMQLVREDHEDAFDCDVVRYSDVESLVAGRVPDFKVDVAHASLLDCPCMRFPER
jgi:hypothetical protein